MNKTHIEICHARSTKYRIYVRNKECIEKYTLLNIISKLPVVSYDRADDSYIISAYHYKKTVEIFESNNIEVSITKKVSDINKLLANKFKMSRLEAFEYPSMWRKDHNPPIALYDYQIKGVQCCMRNLKYVLGDGLGVGKSVQAITVILKAFEQGYDRALIVCINSLKFQWKAEIEKFTTFDNILLLGENKLPCSKDETFYFDMCSNKCKTCSKMFECRDYIKNTQKLRKKQILTIRKKQIIIMNYEQLRLVQGEIIRGKFDIYIADEASKLKSYKSAMTKAMTKISNKFDYGDIFIPMSGTLVENNIYEFYPVFSMVDKDIFGNWHNFNNMYVRKDHWGKIIGCVNLDYLKETVSNFLLRRTIDEVWKDRPEIVENLRYCEMGEFQRRIYNTVLSCEIEKLKSEGLAKKISYAQYATLISYLIMVASSVETVKELTDKKDVDKYSCKLAMLKEILTEEMSGQQVVIFSKYAYKIIPLIKRELDRLKIKNHSITGADDSESKNKKVNDFKANKVQVIICSDVLGYGVNLQNANYMVNFDLPWNPAVLEQRIGRIYRNGQTKTTYIVNLIAKDSMEEHVLNIIYTKQSFIEKFFKRGISQKSSSKKKLISEILREINI